MARKNLTVQLDEGLLKQSRRLAVDDDKSLSEWVADLIVEAVRRRTGRDAVRRKACAVLDKPLHLGGAVFGRDELHER